VALALVCALAPLEGALAQDAGGDGLLVLAAASLTDVLPAVASAWEEEGGVPVRFSFDATSRLAAQALQSSADLFVAADEDWMGWLVERGAVEPAGVRNFLGNRLVLVAPADEASPGSIEDLSAVGTLALAGENVPAGRYARQALESAGLWQALAPKVVRAGSVRGALEWVAGGEAGAGVVYRTDALVEGRVRTVHVFPEESHRPVRYPAAVLASAAEPDAAEAFLTFASGPRGRAVFAAAGFAVEAVEADVARARAEPRGPSVRSAIWISLVVAFLATVVGLVPALTLGWVLARHDFHGKSLLSTVVLAPLVMPPVVTGFLLLSLLGTQGLLGGWLTGLGITVPFTLLGAAIAALVVGLPLYVISVRGAFEAVDPAYEELSWTLGAPPRRTFLRISLPLALPGIVAGSVLAFARALGEFGATVVLAGNVEGSTRTIALAVYTLLESPEGRGATWVLVGASVAISLGALLGYEALSRRQRRRLEDHRVR
jgi:molybdate transport system permease protein